MLTYWGVPCTRLEIDRSIRPFDLFTPPDALVRCARAHGMRAALKVDASVEDLARLVDCGAPPIVLVDPGTRGDLSLHYVAVTGYERAPEGEIAELAIADPASGTTYALGAEALDARWRHLALAWIPIGLSRLMISVVPDDGRTIPGADGVQRRAAEIPLPASSRRARLRSAPALKLASLIGGGARAAEIAAGRLFSARRRAER